MSDNTFAFNGQIVCEPVKTFLDKLTNRGFVMLRNGDDPDTLHIHVGPQSLHYKLQSPVMMSEIDVTEDAYYLAPAGENQFMCECDYHIIKLVSPGSPYGITKVGTIRE